MFMNIFDTHTKLYIITVTELSLYNKNKSEKTLIVRKRNYMFTLYMMDLALRKNNSMVALSFR